ncbi:MAG TPA: hypothetical protein VHE14_03570 [Solirubrobacteraceae bacterium]|nr:hypothetical protein [Solirubrobacteraceae bacterium]
MACLFAVAASSALAVSHRPAGPRYSGHTNQVSRDVSIRVSRRRTAVVRFQIGWDASCAHATPFGASTDVVRSLHIRRSGAFKSHGHYSIALPDGSSANVTASLSGRFVSSDAARGVFSAVVVTVDRGNHLLDQCQTGAIRWIALQE